jgi:isopentenyl diphosphate isomerase/L-lactate dehydrogenase-like FMN-dependent dehydrogenase
MVLALSSTTAVEEIGAVAGLDLWFQLYPFADEAANRDVIGRATAAGARCSS